PRAIRSAIPAKNLQDPPPTRQVVVPAREAMPGPRTACSTGDWIMNARPLTVATIAFAALASTAAATNYGVNWMQMPPTPVGSAPPFTGSYNLPGVGPVQMTYSAHPDFTEARFQNPALASGSVTYGPDNYAWTNHEMLARTNWAYSGVINSSW